MKLSLTLGEAWTVLVSQYRLLILADKSLARELRYQVHRNIVAMTRPSEGESVIEMEVEADESDLWLLATTIDPLFSLTSKSNEGQTLLVKVF